MKTSRRDFMKTSALSTGALMAPNLLRAVNNTKKKPNILVIQTDQQSSWTLGCYGGALKPDSLSTPNIDRLVKEGAKLDNFFTNCAICTPSRSCFQTGRYPSSNGAVHNSVPMHDDEVTLGRLFRDHGYDTGYMGKWHLAGKERSHHHPDKNGVKR